MLACPRCRSIYRAQVRRCGIDGTELVERDTDPLIGATVDRYRILGRISEGSMGSVYQASHALLDRRYAVKVLFGDFGAQQELVERFRREATAASAIQHPNVINVVDFGTTAEGLSFMVMELAEGSTLEAVMARDGVFSAARAAGIARQIADALSAAHRLGFVHRDIKPANVMVLAAKAPEQIKVLDFGVARQTLAATSTHVTGSGMVVGTPVYMAPEQAADGRITPRADLYALGVMLYEMLSGKPPFDHQNAAHVLLHHITQVPPPLAPCGGLERLVKRLLAKRPEERPASAEEVVQAIDRLALGAGGSPEARADLIVDLDLDIALSTVVTIAPEVYQGVSDATVDTEDLDPFIASDPLEAGFMGTGPATVEDLAPRSPAPSSGSSPPLGQAPVALFDSNQESTVEREIAGIIRGAIMDDVLEETDTARLGEGELRRHDSFRETLEVEIPPRRREAAPADERKDTIEMPPASKPPPPSRPPPVPPRTGTLHGFEPWNLRPRPSAAPTSYAFSPYTSEAEESAVAVEARAIATGRRSARWFLVTASLVGLGIASYLLLLR